MLLLLLRFREGKRLPTFPTQATGPIASNGPHPNLDKGLRTPSTADAMEEWKRKKRGQTASTKTWGWEFLGGETWHVFYVHPYLGRWCNFDSLIFFNGVETAKQIWSLATRVPLWEMHGFFQSEQAIGIPQMNKRSWSCIKKKLTWKWTKQQVEDVSPIKIGDFPLSC